MRLQQRDAPEICLLSKEKILFLSNVCQGRCTQRPQNAFEFEFLIGRRRETLLFHGLSAEGAKAVDTQTPDDPSFINILSRFVLKVSYLSKHCIGPCESVR